MGSFSRTSLLAATPDRVWARVITPEGVNHELMPIVRMTWPPEVQHLSPQTVEPGRRLFRSWLLLFGVLPFDYDDITVAEIEDGRRFLERSSMLSMRVWEHERTVEPAGPGVTRVTDRVAFQPRIGLPSRLFAPAFRTTFAWRHRRLRKWFGMPQTTLLYDEDCGLCRSILGAVLAWDRDGRLRPVPIGSEEARALTPGMSDAEREASFHLVDADGTVRSAGEALAELVRLLPGGAAAGVPLARLPGLSEAGYRAVAGNRGMLGRLIPEDLKRRADDRIAARRG